MQNIGTIICKSVTINFQMLWANKTWHFKLLSACLEGSWTYLGDPWMDNLPLQLFVCLCWGLTSQSTIFQSCRDGATASWVINQYFRGVKCLPLQLLQKSFQKYFSCLRTIARDRLQWLNFEFRVQCLENISIRNEMPLHAVKTNTCRPCRCFWH